MADIIDLCKERGISPSDMVFVCDCGCQTHYLRADAAVECPSCGRVEEDGGRWLKFVREPPEAPEGETTPHVARVIEGNETALAFFLRGVNKERTAVLIALQKDGYVHVWDDGNYGPQVFRWIKRGVVIALRIMRERFSAYQDTVH